MSKIKISKVVDEVFGNCIKMTNDIVELMVTVDFGPRVIHFSMVGLENMFFQDISMAGLGEKYEVYGGDIMKVYGGHRIWVSPEIMPRCYHPDNSPVECVEIEDGMEFIAPVEKINNIQKIMTIKLIENSNAVILEHTIKNTGVWDIVLAPWCITMLAAGGKEILPQPNRETNYLPNRNISLWDYSAMNDKRVYWGKDFITLTQNSDMTNPFKIGFNNEKGWASYFNKGQVFFKFFEPNIGGDYPDGGCCYETYTNSAMVEMETLGEFVVLQPDEFETFVEEWEIHRSLQIPTDDEDKINQVIRKYIK